MKLYDLIKEGEYISSEIDLNEDFDDVAVTPENIKENCLYILENEKKLPDLGKISFLPKAIVIKNGADPGYSIPKISVEDPRLMSALIHSRFYQIDFEKLKVIGVTGTNGKTTTATMIYSILKQNGIAAGFIGTGKIEANGKILNDKNYSMTTPPPSILYKVIGEMQNAGRTHIVMEVSSHALVQKRVSSIPFEYALFTNLSSEHMDLHGDMEEYFEAKKMLFSMAKKMIINIDDPYARRLSEEIGTDRITVGVIFPADVYVRNVEDYGFEGVSYYYNGQSFNFKARLNIPGIYNIYNSLLAASMCIDLGISPCNVKKALSEITLIPGRFEIIKDEITVIIDYAHTEEAFAEILKSIRGNKGSSRLTVVFGCGGERDVHKRPKMAAYAERYADNIIVTSDNPRREDPKAIIEDIIKGFKKNSYKIRESRRDAIMMAIKEASRGDIVAVIGKGAEEYNIDKDGYHPFSEKEIISEALRLRKCE